MVETALSARCFLNTSLPLKQSAVLCCRSIYILSQPSRTACHFERPFLCFNISLLLFIKVEQTAMPIMVLSQRKYHWTILLPTPALNTARPTKYRSPSLNHNTAWPRTSQRIRGRVRIYVTTCPLCSYKTAVQ